jgi:hypothetical protein
MNFMRSSPAFAARLVARAARLGAASLSSRTIAGKFDIDPSPAMLSGSETKRAGQTARPAHGFVATRA